MDFFHFLYDRIVPLAIKNKYRNYRKYLKYKKFDTCSPDTIPIIRKSLEINRNLPGDYYEFGLYKGFSFLKAFEFARQLGCVDTNFFGFDSFAGLPDIEAIDSGSKFKKGDYSYSYSDVVKSLSKGKVLWDKCFLIQGYYNEVLKSEAILSKYNFGKAKVILIDCDLYSSTRDVLEFVSKFIQDGTIIIMDDWNCFEADNNKGERRAMGEFLRDNINYELIHLGDFGWHGAFFQIKNK